MRKARRREGRRRIRVEKRRLGGRGSEPRKKMRVLKEGRRDKGRKGGGRGVDHAGGS